MLALLMYHCWYVVLGICGLCYGVMLIINDVIGVIVVNLYVDNGTVVRVDAGCVIVVRVDTGCVIVEKF